MKTSHILMVFVVVSSVVFTFAAEEGKKEPASQKNEIQDKDTIKPPHDMVLEKKFPADGPGMNEIEIWRQQVACCESAYMKINSLCETNTKGGDLESTLYVYYMCKMARARLYWAESRWKDCHKEALAAVYAAKAFLEQAELVTGEMDYYHNSCVKRVDAHSKLTEARLLLNEVIAKEKLEDEKKGDKDSKAIID